MYVLLHKMSNVFNVYISVLWNYICKKNVQITIRILP